MKNTLLARAGLIIVLLGLTALVQTARMDSIDNEITQIQKDVAANGYQWQAGRTSVMEVPLAERQALCGLRMPADYVEPLPEPHASAMSLPSRYDWRDSNGVSPVKNQGGCGSCWAFAPVAALESLVMIYNQWTPDLSEQQLLSCNTKGYTCDGGWLDVAAHFVNPGCVDETCMPYQGNDQVPCTQQNCQYIVQTAGYHFINTDADSIKNALLTGPVACAMHVYDDLYSYRSGCYQHAGHDAVNHGVTIIGWDDSQCGGAWIVKNSWGARWGQSGFFYIKIGDSNIGSGAMTIDYSGQSGNATPTPPPSFSPTPTQPPAPAFSLQLFLNQTIYHTGDILGLDFKVTNHRSATDGFLYVALEIYGQYIFYPAWTDEPAGVEFSAPDNMDITFQLMNLTMPSPLPPGGPFTFYAICTQPSTTTLISNVTSVSFSLE